MSTTIKRWVLALACLAVGAGASAQYYGAPYTPYPVYAPAARTLTPVDTGRDAVSFRIGSASGKNAIALKTNLLYWATVTPNLGVEFAVAPNWTIELAGGFNNREVNAPAVSDADVENPDYKSYKHWVVKPEARYWLNERFSGHFFGVHGIYGDYNVARLDVPLLFEKESFYEGDAYGGGFVYGYVWRVADRFRIETSVGVGALQMTYTKKDSAAAVLEAGASRFKKTYFGPTSAGVKLVLMLK